MNFGQIKLACSIASLSAAMFAFGGVKAQAQTPQIQAQPQTANTYVETPKKVAQFTPGASTRFWP